MLTSADVLTYAEAGVQNSWGRGTCGGSHGHGHAADVLLPLKMLLPEDRIVVDMDSGDVC